MMLWLFIGLMAAASFAFLAWPLFAAPKENQGPDEIDYLVAQLDDVERERACGALSEAEAEAARLEARRRLLSAGRAGRKAPAPGGPAIAANLRRGALVAVGAIPLAAIALYLGLGAYGGLSQKPAAPAAAAAMDPEERARQSEAMIAALRRRLGDNPGDLEGWTLLGRTSAAMGRFGEAAAAFEKALALSPDTAALHAAYAEALIFARQGEVGGEAKAALARALELDPADPRARFYDARRLVQEGDREGALRKLAALVNEAPDDAAWLPLAHYELISVAMALGKPLDASGLTETAQGRLRKAVSADLAAREQAAGASPAPRGPSAEDVEAARAMAPEAQRQMIEGMVARLAARLENEPDDAEGWAKLGRSYGVLGEPAKSAEAYGKAAALRPGDGAIALAYAQALVAETEAAKAELDDRTVGVLQAVLARDEANSFALYYLGLAAMQKADHDAARQYWMKLQALLPPGSDEANAVGEQLRALPE